MSPSPLRPFAEHEALYRSADSSTAAAMEALAECCSGDWALLKLACDDRVERELLVDPALDYEPAPRPPRTSSTTRTSRRPSSSDSTSAATVDRLREIPADVYVERLIGEPIGRSRKITCPFHGDGQERTPSFHVYRDDRGWYCHGCQSGGDIFTLASLLTGTPDRGADWHVLVDVLTEVFK